MTKHKPIYHARKVNRWKGLVEPQPFHRFLRGDESFLAHLSRQAHKVSL